MPRCTHWVKFVQHCSEIFKSLALNSSQQNFLIVKKFREVLAPCNAHSRVMGGLCRDKRKYAVPDRDSNPVFLFLLYFKKKYWMTWPETAVFDVLAACPLMNAQGLWPARPTCSANGRLKSDAPQRVKLGASPPGKTLPTMPRASLKYFMKAKSPLVSRAWERICCVQEPSERNRLWCAYLLGRFP